MNKAQEQYRPNLKTEEDMNFMRSKAILIGLILVLVFCFLQPCSTFAQHLKIVEKSTNMPGILCAVDLSTLNAVSYWLEDNGIYYITPKNEIRYLNLLEGTDTLLRISSQCLNADDTCYTNHDRGICQCDFKTGKILLVSRDADRIIEFDPLSIKADYVDTPYLKQFLFLDDVFFMLVASEDGSDASAYIFSAQGDIVRHMDHQEIQMISAYKEDQVLASCNNMLLSFDLYGNVVHSNIVKTDVFSYSPSIDQILFVSGGNVYRSNGDKAPELVFIAPYAYASETTSYQKIQIHKMNAIHDDLFLFSSNTHAYLAQMEPISSTLKIYWYDNGVDFVSHALKLFEEEDPYVKVQFVYCNDSSEIPDIYPVANEGVADLSYLKRDEGMLRLTSSAAICGNHSTYLAQVQDMLSYSDGEPFAIPIGFQISPWFVNAKLWMELDLPSLPRTLDEFMDLIVLWNYEYAAKYPDIVFTGEGGYGSMKAGLLYALTQQYAFEQLDSDEPLNFDCEAYKNLIHKVLTLPNNMPCTYNNGPLALIRSCIDTKMPWGSLLDIEHGEVMRGMMYGYSDGNSIANDYHWFMPPSISKDVTPRVGARISALTIPKGADNPALALDFMEFCLTHQNMIQPDLSYMLTAQNPQNCGIREQLHRQYIEMLPFLSFHINALGGMAATYDVSDSFANFIGNEMREAISTDLEAEISYLIDRLNFTSNLVLNRDRPTWISRD